MSPSKLRAFHYSVRDTLLPHLKKHSQTDALALDQLVGRTGAPQTVIQHNMNENNALNRKITLSGALTVLSVVTSEIFGVKIVLDTNTSEKYWHKDVMLLHILDSTTNNHAGSFYLDPFLRPGKLARSATSPLFTRGVSRRPRAAVTLCIPPPVWDDEPVFLSIDDLECFAHEIGHVMQYVLNMSKLGALLGPERDTESLEVVPKLMEKFATDEAIVTAMIQQSGTSEDTNLATLVSDTMRLRSRRKHFELAQLSFGSTFGDLTEHSLGLMPRQVSVHVVNILV